MPDRDELEFHWIFTVLRRWWWLILGGTLLAAALAFIVLSVLPPTYEASSTLLIQPAENTNTTEYNTLVAGERLAYTYSEMLKSRPVLEPALAELGLTDKPDSLAERITVEPIRGTQLIRFSVTSDTPEQAALLANSIAKAFTTQVGAIQSGQYDMALENLQNQMDTLAAEIEAAQTKIQTLSAQKSADEAELLWRENLLTDTRTSYRNLQNDIFNLQLTIDQVQESVKIIEPASLSGSPFLPKATVTLLFNPTPVPGGSTYSPLTFNEMLTSTSILEAALAQMELESGVQYWLDRVATEPVRDTQLILLEVSYADGELASDLANTMAAIFVDQVQGMLSKPYTESLDAMQSQLETLSAQMESSQARITALTAAKLQAETDISLQENLLPIYRSDYRTIQQDYEQLSLIAQKASDTVVVTEPAALPENPVSQTALYVALAMLVGAGLSTTAAFVLQYLDDTIRVSSDLEPLLNLDTLGTIGHLADTDNELVTAKQPRAPTSEAFRVLAANLRLSSSDHPIHTLLVTSPFSNEGKSMVAANLAVSMARAGLKVILLDGDLRIPRVHRMFALKRNNGLSEVLFQKDLTPNLQATGIHDLRVLTSGIETSNPAELMSTPRLAEILAGLEDAADLVVVDSPPVLSVADTAHLAALVDGVLLVVRVNQTRKRTAQEAVKNLRKVGAHLVGLVLNNMPRSAGGYYAYEYDADAKESPPQRLWKKSRASAIQLFRKHG
jgi:capsular exopolysaccharide synthesis family protein